MTEEQTKAETVSLLQELGLKEYEARCFVALARVPTGTAKEVSEISEVPRTRVYDAVEVLEARGLVEVQHGSPRQYRAVSIEEATHILRQQYVARIETLETHLQALEPPADQAEDLHRQEVWALTGAEAIQARTEGLISETDSELVLLVVDETLLTDALIERVQAAQDRDATVIIGGATDAIISRVETVLPTVQTFETDLEWLMGPAADDEVAISRVLLADRQTLLVSSFYPHDGDAHDEQAIFATGLDNGIVVLLRRLVATGLLPARDTSEATSVYS